MWSIHIQFDVFFLLNFVRLCRKHILVWITNTIEQHICSWAAAAAACQTPSQYTGKASVTVTGRQCQAWASQSPQAHTVGSQNSQFPDGSVAAAGNYCRDPDNTGYPWCYTTNSGIRWEACTVDLCGKNDNQYANRYAVIDSEGYTLRSMMLTIEKAIEVWQTCTATKCKCMF